MNQSIRKLNDNEQRSVNLAVDFLVPYVHSIVEISSEVDLPIDKFKEEFCAAGAGQFGAGWCWLVKDTDGSLKVTKTENGVNPLCFGQSALLGCDVWEHSYYIDFRNKRPAYLSNFLDKLVNWENVAARM